MALSDAHAWLVAYDVSDPKRLQQVHAYIVKRAAALQYSVFLAIWTERELMRALEGLRAQINLRRDDVRAYPVPEEGRIEVRGAVFCGDGIHLTGTKSNLLRILCDFGGQIREIPETLRRHSSAERDIR
jgi:CRISPR-associated protein Cas2